MNSDPPHSGVDIAVDQEVGLAHSPTNAPFYLGLAERGSFGEGAWKRLGAPEFTKHRSLCFHNYMWIVPPFSAFRGELAGQGSEADIQAPPKPRSVPMRAQGCGGTKKEGLVFPGSVIPV